MAARSFLDKTGLTYYDATIRPTLKQVKRVDVATDITAYVDAMPNQTLQYFRATGNTDPSLVPADFKWGSGMAYRLTNTEAVIIIYGTMNSGIAILRKASGTWATNWEIYKVYSEASSSAAGLLSTTYYDSLASTDSAVTQAEVDALFT